MDPVPGLTQGDFAPPTVPFDLLSAFPRRARRGPAPVDTSARGRASQAGKGIGLRPARPTAGCARAHRLRPSGDACGLPGPTGPHPPPAALTRSAMAWMSAVAGCVAVGAPHIISAAGAAGGREPQAAVTRKQRARWSSGLWREQLTETEPPDLVRRSRDARAEPRRAAGGESGTGNGVPGARDGNGARGVLIGMRRG